jgi:hypothetical protein
MHHLKHNKEGQLITIYLNTIDTKNELLKT